MRTADKNHLRSRIREILKAENPGSVIVRNHLDAPGKLEGVAEGGFLPLLLPALGTVASALAPAVGSLVNFGVKKLTGEGAPKAPRKPSAWNAHVKAVSKKTGLVGPDLFAKAKETYVKQGPAKKAPKDPKQMKSPWNSHVAMIASKTGLSGPALFSEAKKSYVKMAPKAKAPRAPRKSMKAKGGSVDSEALGGDAYFGSGLMVASPGDSARPHIGSTLKAYGKRRAHYEQVRPLVGAY